MQAKPYFCITCYDIINMRHKHTFDINFPPEMVPVGLVLPHFFFFQQCLYFCLAVILSPDSSNTVY